MTPAAAVWFGGRLEVPLNCTARALPCTFVERSSRDDVRAVFSRFGVADAKRAADTDPTEEVFLLTPTAMSSVDTDQLTQALMAALPHVRVWVVEDSARWSSESL
jgi:hypothetical protein